MSRSLCMLVEITFIGSVCNTHIRSWDNNYGFQNIIIIVSMRDFKLSLIFISLGPDLVMFVTSLNSTCFNNLLPVTIISLLVA